MTAATTSIPARRPLAAHSFFLAALIAFVAFRLFPVRVPAVDAVAAALVLGRLISGIALLRGTERARRFAFGVAAATLVVGLLAVTLLAVSVAMVAGIYDAVGDGAAIAFALVLLFFVPYLVVFPALELRALAPKTP